MFIEITTRRGEKICLNVNHILYITDNNTYTTIVDILGIDYKINSPYQQVLKRIYNRFNSAQVVNYVDID